MRQMGVLINKSWGGISPRNSSMLPRELWDSVMLCLVFALINKDISPMIIARKAEGCGGVCPQLGAYVILRLLV